MKSTSVLLTSLTLIRLTLAATTSTSSSSLLNPTTCPDGSPSRTLPYGSSPTLTLTACCPGALSANAQGPADNVSYNLMCAVNCETAYAVNEGSTATAITSSDCRSASVGAEDYTELIYGSMAGKVTGSGSTGASASATRMWAGTSSSRAGAPGVGEVGGLGRGMIGVLAAVLGAVVV